MKEVHCKLDTLSLMNYLRAWHKEVVGFYPDMEVLIVMLASLRDGKCVVLIAHEIE
jgi:hypothetical protein